MDFFNQLFFDNTIKSYCIVASFILLMLILKKYFSRYLAKLLSKLANKIWSNVDQSAFINLVVAPLEWLLFILTTVFAIDKLNYPSAWEFKIYGHELGEVFTKLGMTIIIITITWFFLRIIDFIALVLELKAAATDDKTDDQLVIFFRDFLKVIIGILGILWLIKVCFNQPISGLLTSLSIVGAALALAAKESLENLIASFIIFFDKPFAAGDTVKVNTVSGIVERIGLRSTRIRTMDKTIVSVPNKQMVDSVVDNWSMRTQFRTEIKLEISIKTNSIALQSIIEEIKILLKSNDIIIASSVYLIDINKLANVIMVEYFTMPVALEVFNNLKETKLFKIKKLLFDNNIEMCNLENLNTKN